MPCHGSLISELELKRTPPRQARLSACRLWDGAAALFLSLSAVAMSWWCVFGCAELCEEERPVPICLSLSCTGGWIWPKPIKILGKTSKYVKPLLLSPSTAAKGDGAPCAALLLALSSRGITPAGCRATCPVPALPFAGAVLAEGHQGRRIGSQVVCCHLTRVGRMCRTSPRASVLTSVCSWWCCWKREEWLLPSSGRRAGCPICWCGVKGKSSACARAAKQRCRCGLSRCRGGERLHGTWELLDAECRHLPRALARPVS